VEIKLTDFFSSISSKLEAKLNSGKIVLGGPVQPMSVYVLYSDDDRFKPLIKINDEISVSQDVELIKSILNDDGPETFLVSFGFTGWSEGQLETEILSGNWLITPSSKEIIFNTPNDQKINKVSKLAGFNLQTVSSNYGSS
jgi:putative transcriptional regulator